VLNVRSFITSLKSLGPETVPCGVPAPTIVVLDTESPFSLLWVLNQIQYALEEKVLVQGLF